MTPRIAITDPALLERQTLAQGDFLAHFLGVIGNFPPREWTPAAFAHGLRYPWTRPNRSYLLRDGQAALLHELDAGGRAAALERRAGRTPLLAIGSNAAPKNLALKLAHHPEPDDREVLVLAGDLHDFDVVASAAITVYGALPASLAVSPGTRVNAALLFVNATQLTTLTWGELTYRVGRLNGARFTSEDGTEHASPLAFVSRWGAFAPGGDPAPLAVIPARGRRTRAWAQRELIDRVAEIVLGGGGAEAAIRALFADPAAFAGRAIPMLAGHARPFEFPGWTPIGPDGRL